MDSRRDFLEEEKAPYVFGIGTVGAGIERAFFADSEKNALDPRKCTIRSHKSIRIKDSDNGNPCIGNVRQRDQCSANLLKGGKGGT